MTFLVTDAAMRPASPERRCFYCRHVIGGLHASDCVLVKKQVTVRLEISYQIAVPASWSSEQIEFHRNESSWCASNLVAELDERFGDGAPACACGAAKFTHVSDDSKPYLEER